MAGRLDGHRELVECFWADTRLRAWPSDAVLLRCTRRWHGSHSVRGAPADPKVASFRLP
jgi:hypothetical protein